MIHWTCPLREQNRCEEQFLQYNENGKLIYGLNVSVLINRVITRVYRKSDKGTEDWMRGQITLQYKWSIIVQSIACFKDLGKISLHVDQTLLYMESNELQAHGGETFTQKKS